MGLSSLSTLLSRIMKGVHFPAIEKAGEVLYIYFLFYIEYYVRSDCKKTNSFIYFCYSNLHQFTLLFFISIFHFLGFYL